MIIYNTWISYLIVCVKLFENMIKLSVHIARTLHCGWFIDHSLQWLVHMRDRSGHFATVEAQNKMHKGVCMHKAVCGLWHHIWWCRMHSMGQADRALFTRPFLSSWVGGTGPRDYTTVSTRPGTTLMHQYVAQMSIRPFYGVEGRWILAGYSAWE